MREIKFRAWDKESKRILNIARFDFADHTVYSHLFACDGYLAENLKIMQYTGLKDKNGTEIYDGDIVKFNDFWSEITGGNVGDTIRTCFVEYIMSGFFLRDVLDEEYEEDLGMALINDDEFEVIGNIYEHPHLI